MSLKPEEISTSIEDFEAVIDLIDCPISLDLETSGLTPFIAEPTWLSWACGEKVGAIPIEHRNPFSQDDVKDRVTAALKKLHQRSSQNVIWHNAIFDISILVSSGWLSLGDIHSKSLFDTMLASYILNPVKNNENGKHSLKYLYREIKSETDPIQPSFEATAKGCDFADVPIEEAKWYAGFDAWATLKLYNKLFLELSKKENIDLFNYFKNIEMPHVLTTVEISTTGMNLIPQNKLPADLKSITNLNKEYNDTLDKIFDLAGHTFNFTSPNALRAALFIKIGIDPLGRGKKSGQYSVDKWTLARIFAEVDSQLTYVKDKNYVEKKKKLIAWTLYAKLLIENIKKHEEFNNGRNHKTNLIHPKFRQTTSSGRYSCRSPNTLSMSATSQIKDYLIPKKENAFVIADFGQIDLRVIANETAAVNINSEMAKAVNNGVDLHINTLAIFDNDTHELNIKKIHFKDDDPTHFEKLDGTTESNIDPDLSYKLKEIKKRRSSIAKPVNFGISYGLGPAGLLSNLNNSDKFQEIIFKKTKNAIDETEWLEQLSKQTNRLKFNSDQATEFLSQFQSTYPEIPKFQEKIELNDLQKSGSTTNIFGRRSRAEGVPHLLSENAVIDVSVGFGEWYRVSCRGLKYEKSGFTCLITKVQGIDVGKVIDDRKIIDDPLPRFNFDVTQLDYAITQFNQGNICKKALVDTIKNNFENGLWGAENLFENVKAALPMIDSESAALSDEHCYPFVHFKHSQIFFIQTGPLSTFMRYPGYDALRRKLISYRVSSTSMDICKIAMIEFRKAAQTWYKRGKLKSIPRIINCIHDEIAIECHADDIKLVKTLLQRRMSFKGFVHQKYLAKDRNLFVKIEADIGSSDVSYAKAKPA